MRTLLAALVATGGLAHSAPPPYPFSFSMVDVAPGIHAFVEPFGSAIVSGNSVAIVGTEAVMVVDTGQHPRLTRRMIAEIRRLTSRPVRFVVNTHWHNDHVAGNAIYAEEFPGVTVIAHAFTARMLESAVRPFAGARCRAFLGSQSAALREMLASGKGSDGQPLAQPRRARLERFVREADAGMEECLEFRHRGADLAFEDRITVQLGGREVEVRWLGRANTAGDAVVVVPDAKAVIAGDLVVHPFPFAVQSYISEWATVLRKLEALDPAIIIPGHGPVMRDRQYVVAVRELLDSIMEQARAAWQPGMAVEELRRAIDLSRHRERIAGMDPFLRANFDAMITQSAVRRAWEELRGAFEPEAMPGS